MLYFILLLLCSFFLIIFNNILSTVKESNKRDNLLKNKNNKECLVDKIPEPSELQIENTIVITIL